MTSQSTFCVKTDFMSKQRKLPTYWFVLVGNKRNKLVPDTGIVIVVTLSLRHLQGCRRNRCPMDITGWTSCICGICILNVHTFNYNCRSVPFTVTQFTLNKGRNGSYSIICKVPCCLLSLLLQHSFYLYLNVLHNLRTSVQVKMQ